MQDGRGHRGGRGWGDIGGSVNKPLDKEYWKDKECFNYNRKGHPSIILPEVEKDVDDASSSSRYSQEKNLTKLTKDFEKMIKSFIHLQQLK